MTLRHPIVEPNPTDPFKDCKLGRKKYADILTTIISKHPDGFVLALNSAWGTGKTTFIKMWQASLNKDGFETIYINAWENDLDSNPLAAILSELRHLNYNDEKHFAELLKKGAVLVKRGVPLLFKAFLEKHFTEKGVAEIGSAFAEGAFDLLKTEVEKYAERKEGIIEFKKQLAEYISEASHKKNVIIYIDELDRCRPNYAVEFLETIKHFFSVSNITFVLSIDKVQLGHAVRGVYGSEGLDADGYLKRFIDLEFTLPKPLANHITDYYFSYFDLISFFNAGIRRQMPDLRGEDSGFRNTSDVLLENLDLNLREVEKIYSLCKVGTYFFKSNEPLFSDLYFFLIVCKVKKSDFYHLLLNQGLLHIDIQSHFRNLFNVNLSEESERALTELEAGIVYMYVIAQYGKADSVVQKRENAYAVMTKTRFTQGAFEKTFINKVIQYASHSHFKDISLDYLLDKIELIDNLS